MITAVAPADLPAIRRLIEAALRSGVTPLEADIQYLIEDIGRSLDHWATAPAGKLHLKFVDGDAIAGVILVKDAWNLTNLFVDPRYQGRGIGRALVEQVLLQCRGQSPRDALLVNSSSNAVGFYRRLGFAPAGDPRDLPGGCVPLRYDFRSPPGASP